MKRAEPLGLIVLLLGALRIAYVAALSPHEPRIDARYAGLAELLPRPQRPVGYLSESGLATRDGQRRFGEASYALSPQILLPDDGSAELVLVDLEAARSSELEAVAQRLSLHIVRTSSSGVALLSRTKPPPSLQ